MSHAHASSAAPKSIPAKDADWKGVSLISLVVPVPGTLENNGSSEVRHKSDNATADYAEGDRPLFGISKS
jgi:hypothetical protein